MSVITPLNLSATAQRMLATLPLYYADNPITARVLQGWADEIDRMDAMLDTLKTGLVPTFATDNLNMLAVWETIFGLPVSPPVTVAQRQAAVKAAIRRLNAVTAMDVLVLLGAPAGPAAFSIDRDTPGLLQDTMTIHAVEGSYTASVIQRVAVDAWPAHRELLFAYDAGFTLDLSVLDTDAL